MSRSASVVGPIRTWIGGKMPTLCVAESDAPGFGLWTCSATMAPAASVGAYDARNSVDEMNAVARAVVPQ